MPVKKNALNDERLKKLIEKYSYAPDFFDQNLIDQGSRNAYGDQLLHAACVAGDVDDINFLLSINADISSKGDKGYTPLHYAVEQGNICAVEALLKNGADAFIKNDDGELRYDLALMLNHMEILRMLASRQSC